MSVAYLAGLQPSEHPPDFGKYIAKANLGADPIQTLEEQSERMRTLLGALPAEKRLYRYAPGKWSVQEIIGHVTDGERIFAYRALRIARNDQTPLPGFDQDPYVVAAEADAREWSSLVGEWDAVRLSTILMLRNWPAAAWTRMGVSNDAPASARALVAVMIGHVEHHLAILREHYFAPTSGTVI